MFNLLCYLSKQARKPQSCADSILRLTQQLNTQSFELLACAAKKGRRVAEQPPDYKQNLPSFLLHFHLCASQLYQTHVPDILSKLILRGRWLPKNMGQGHYGQQWTMDVPREKVKDESTDSCSRKWMTIQSRCANSKFIWQYFENGKKLTQKQSFQRGAIYKCIAMSEAWKETRQAMNGQW